MEPAAVSTEAAPILVTRDLTKSFRRLTALKNHSVEVKRGEIVGVIGPNGSGKSTFFNRRHRLPEAECRHRAFRRAGDPASARPADRPAGRGPHLPGNAALSPTQRAREFARGGPAAPSAWASPMPFLGLPRLGQVNRAVDQLTDEMLELIDLRARADSRAADLPYGDQRRLELVRALATRPRLLMLDEPAAGMNAAETQSLLRLIDDIRRRYDLAVIVVEHDMDLIMNLCDRIQVLAHGEIIFEGSPPEVQANPRVREVYLGQA